MRMTIEEAKKLELPALKELEPEVLVSLAEQLGLINTEVKRLLWAHMPAASQVHVLYTMLRETHLPGVDYSLLLPEEVHADRLGAYARIMRNVSSSIQALQLVQRSLTMTPSVFNAEELRRLEASTVELYETVRLLLNDDVTPTHHSAFMSDEFQHEITK